MAKPSKRDSVSQGTLYLGELFWGERFGQDFTLRHEEGGALFVGSDGKVHFVGAAAAVPQHLSPTQKIQLPMGQFLTPAFFDLHIHFPQAEMIGAWAGSLLQWLEKKTFPAEMHYEDTTFAAIKARQFCSLLGQNGVGTAMAFSSSHEGATQTLFESFENSGLRGIIGKVSMDQHAPPSLLPDTTQERHKLEALIRNWHGKDSRLFVALTPRFVPSCTTTLLEILGDLAAAHPSVYIQSHIDENLDEVAWVKRLFPESKHYFDVYRKFGLARSNTFLAHGIHTSDQALRDMRQCGIQITHCPTSNLFLGSGLFPSKRYSAAGVSYSYASDVGAGTSFSPWATMAGAYQVAALQGLHLTPEEIFGRSTLVPAEQLAIPGVDGTFKVGGDADLVIWDRREDGMLQKQWLDLVPKQRLFRIMFHHGDVEAVETLVRGKRVWARDFKS